MAMTLRDRSEQFEELEIRIEHIFSLAFQPDYSALSDNVRDCLDDLGNLEEAGFSLEALGLRADLDDEYPDESDVANALLTRGHDGFFILASTPRREIRNGRVTTSWGCYWQKWFYGINLEDALDQAAVWVAEQNKVLPAPDAAAADAASNPDVSSGSTNV